MWPCTRAGNPRTGRLGTAVLALFFFCIATASADRLPPDPAEALRQALKDPADKSDLDDRIAALRNLGEMRRVILALYDLPLKMPKNRVDDALRARDQLIGRSQNAVRAAIREGDTDRRLAAVLLVGEMGVSLPGSRATTSLAGHLFTADLIDLMKRGEPRLMEAAARALGRIDPDTGVAVPALGELLVLQR